MQPTNFTENTFDFRGLVQLAIRTNKHCMICTGQLNDCGKANGVSC